MNILKKFDYFPKLSETVEVKKTSQGGFIFTFFLGLMAVLCLMEVYSLLFGAPITEPFIEKPDLDEKIRVNFNISIYDVPCEALGLDFQDITGTHFEDLQQTIYKLDLNSAGYIVDKNKYEVVKKFENKNFFPSHPFWESILGKKNKVNSCYGAELYEGQECKTCQDVQRAYMQRGWPLPILDVFAQCKAIKYKTPRTLTEEVIENVTARTYTLEELLGDNSSPQFSLENSLFVVEDLKENHIFSFEIARSNCRNPQEAILEFSYKDFTTGDIKQARTKPVFFRESHCKMYFPLKIKSIADDELVIESLLLEEKELHIQINNDDMFNVTVVNGASKSNTDFPNALFKRGLGNIKGRMLHAEFYGFDDKHPTVITMQQIEYFRKSIGRGCQVVGTMYIKKVPGNFHISTHHKGLGLQYVESPLTAKHKIHLLEFTKEEGKITQGKYSKATNYLDGLLAEPPLSHDVQYYVKILSSTYNHPVWGEKKFFEYVAHMDITPKYRNVILLEFKYEFDPISMRYIDRSKTLSHFIISLLAIIGGMFATSTFIDRIFSKWK